MKTRVTLPRSMLVVFLLIGCSGYGDDDVFPDGEYGTIEHALCGSVTLTSSVASPSTPGTSVTFTASAGCDVGDTPEYRFFQRGPGEPGYTQVQAYSTTDSWVWNQTGAEPEGRYDVLVYARAVGSGVGYETWRVRSHFLETGDTCGTDATLTGTHAPADSDVNLTASVGCTGDATPWYRFLAKGPNDASHTEIRNFATTATFGFDVEGEDVGLWHFVVQTAVEGSTVVHGNADVAINNGRCGTTGQDPNLTLSGERLSGNVYRLTAAVPCTGANSPRYRFFNRPPGGTYTEIRPYGTSDTFDWDATGQPDGEHTILVYSRGRDSSASWEGWRTMPLNIGDFGVCDDTVLSASPGNPVAIGATVEFSAAVTCTLDATAESRFLVRRPGETTYQELRGWGETTFDWDTTAEPDGSHTILVYSRAVGSGATQESFATRNVVLEL